MSSDGRREIANKLQEFAQFLRDEYLDPKHFDGWPGLRKPGEMISFEDASFFLLGCCIDLQEYAWRAWQKANRFYDGVVPQNAKTRVWHWIANHSRKEWNSRKRRKGLSQSQLARSYDLHWMNREHQRVHKVAVSLVDRYGGDPRRVWENRPGTSVLGTLKEELGLGDGIARMIVGALRDHNIIKLQSSDCKPDGQICRMMKTLGLAGSEKAEEVSKAGRKWFTDPWLVDGALWELGKDYEIRNLADFEKLHENMRVWKGIQPRVKEIVRSIADHFQKDRSLRSRWDVDCEPTHHWAGIYLKRIDGPLRKDMEDEDSTLWAWIGVGLYKTFVIAVDVGGNRKYFSEEVARFCRSKELKEERQSSSGRWGMREYYYERQVNEEHLLDRQWLLRNFSLELKRAQGFINAVESIPHEQ